MRQTLNLILLCIIFLANIAFAEVREITDSNELKSLLSSEANKSNLVIFDVEGALITPRDQIFLSSNKVFLDKITQELQAKYNKGVMDSLFGTIMFNRQEQIAYNDIPDLIKQLVSKGVKTLGLSNSLTRLEGTPPYFEEYQIKQLASFGYDFKDMWKSTPEIIFSEVAPVEPGHFPAFKDGILFTAKVNRELALQAFLKKSDLNPAKILFIHDNIEELKSIDTLMSSNGRNFVGINYKAAKNSPALPFSPERAKLQFEILEKDNTWLSDEQADERLKQETNTKK